MRFQQLCLLVYDSRSGSTYFCKELNRVCGIAVSIESDLIKEIVQNAKVISALAPKGIYRYLQQRGRVSALGVTESAFAVYYDQFDGFMPLERVIRAFYAGYMDVKRFADTDVLLVKDGANGFYLNLIADAIPTIKVIFLVRDGRAVLNSKMNTPKVYEANRKMARDPISAARAWVALIGAVSYFKATRDNGVLTVHFEKMISDVPKAVTKVTQFLGCAAVMGTGDYFEAIPERERVIHEKVKGKNDKARIAGWKNELPIFARLMYEKRARTHLAAMGYTDFLDLRPWSKQALTVRLLELGAIVKRVQDWFGYLRNVGKLRRIIVNKIYQFKDRQVKL